ncbi:hypothetical protein DL768_000512 [Monosporascus sp. mg162]|nr:hypothetical protein DL768_000512 [Monosporascus sp. mg162]
MVSAALKYSKLLCLVPVMNATNIVEHFDLVPLADASRRLVDTVFGSLGSCAQSEPHFAHLCNDTKLPSEELEAYIQDQMLGYLEEISWQHWLPAALENDFSRVLERLVWLASAPGDLFRRTQQQRQQLQEELNKLREDRRNQLEEEVGAPKKVKQPATTMVYSQQEPRSCHEHAPLKIHSPHIAQGNPSIAQGLTEGRLRGLERFPQRKGTCQLSDEAAAAYSGQRSIATTLPGNGSSPWTSPWGMCDKPKRQIHLSSQARLCRLNSPEMVP